MASVYKKRGAWWFRVRDATGIWRDRPAKASTKPAAQREALEAQQFADRQRVGLAPSSENMRRTFGELMDLWRERYGQRLRSQTIIPMVEKHLRPTLGKLPLGGAAAALGPLLLSKVEELSPSSLNHLRAYARRLYAIASLPSVGWWARPNPVNRDELPKFKEPKRKPRTLAAEDVPALLAVLAPEWRPMFATAVFLGLRRGELIALRKEDLDLVAGTLTVARSRDADTTKGGRTVTLPIPEPLRPYLETAVRWSRSEWLFPKADGEQRSLDVDVTAVLRRALARQHAAPVPQGRARALVATSAAAALVPFAAPHVRDAAREGQRAPEGRSADTQARRCRHHARYLHARRPGRHARGTFSDLCCQFAANGLDPKR